ncbi:MAG: ribonuclease III [Nitrospiria bacterium]
MTAKDFSLLQERLSHRFRDTTLLRQALTHKSYINESKHKEMTDNERLEFLGDAVLDLSVRQDLMERFPDAPEGDLSKMKAKIVSEETLAQVARRIDLGPFLLLGKGEERTRGKEKPSLLANAMEAIIAAVYLDNGFSAARKLILDRFAVHLRALAPGEIHFDFKTALQEYSQKAFGVLPVYRLVQETGPDHRKRFEIETIVNGKTCAIGVGKSKKAAEQKSAEAALAALRGKEKDAGGESLISD